MKSKFGNSVDDDDPISHLIYRFLSYFSFKIFKYNHVFFDVLVLYFLETSKKKGLDGSTTCLNPGKTRFRIPFSV